MRAGRRWACTHKHCWTRELPHGSAAKEYRQQEREDCENDVRARIEEDSQPVELERLGLSDGPHDSENTTGEVHRTDEYQGKEGKETDHFLAARVRIGRRGLDSEHHNQYRQTDEHPPDNTQDDRKPIHLLNHRPLRHGRIARRKTLGCRRIPLPRGLRSRSRLGHNLRHLSVRFPLGVFTAVTGSAATNCYGVKGMAVRSTTDGLVHLLKRESMAKGVKVYYNDDGTVAIELHIIVENGVNLTAVCHSIMSQVRYVVSSTTGVDVSTVDVYVDSVRF